MTRVFLLFTLALAAAAAQEPETVAWRNGAWFDGTGFRRVDVYSIGDRLSFKIAALRSLLLGLLLDGTFDALHTGTQAVDEIFGHGIGDELLFQGFGQLRKNASDVCNSPIAHGLQILPQLISHDCPFTRRQADCV